MRRALIAIVIILAGIAAVNGAVVTWPALHTKSQDPRNSAITLYSYMRWGVDPSTIVLDLWRISDTASMADVDRVLFDTAKALKDGSFSTVQLAFRGRPLFQMQGAYFRQIGTERDWQNPVYVIRTMPEHIYDMTGSPAFGTWTGGWLGVVGKQMEDHADFHRRWYISQM